MISFEAGVIKEYQENIFLPSPYTDKPLLKCVGLFGKNAGGKSNFIRALSFMKEFVLDSSKESSSTKQINVTPFLLSTESEHNPSTFEVLFHDDNKRYKYGFSITRKQVESEWLFVTSKNKEETLFLRSRQDFVFEKKIKSDAKAKLELLTQLTRGNSLFISVLAQFNNPIGEIVSNWFNNIIIAKDTDHLALIDFTARLMSMNDYKRRIIEIIKHSDLGIESIDEKLKETAQKTNYSYDFLKSIVHSEENNYVVKTKHIKYSGKKDSNEQVVFDLLQNESFGTQKFFGILGPILYSLREKKIIWIDELDARMHTLLFEVMVKIFNSEKYNPNGAQLLFTSHNQYALKKGLRRDQMIMVEKDKYGVSSIGSVYQKSPKTRNDASFDKEYLSGKYGAIPRIQSQLDLFEGL